jgi:hypothetical protein
VTRLQDTLGVMQDAQVAADRLHSLATNEGSGLSPATVFAMGVVAERYRREAERLAVTVPGQLEALKGPHWKKLRKLMEKRRLDAGPSKTWSPGGSSPSPADAVGDASGRGGSATTWAPTPPSPPNPSAMSDDEPDWDDEDAPLLRPLPGMPPPTVGSPAPDHRHAPSEPSLAAPPGGRRRKEPVFLPAPPSTARPGAGRPAPRAEAPDGEGNRSSHDRS